MRCPVCGYVNARSEEYLGVTYFECVDCGYYHPERVKGEEVVS